MKTLKDFTKYLREIRLNDLAQYSMDTIKAMDIPLIKLVLQRGAIKSLDDESVISRTKERLNNFLLSLENGTALDIAKENIKLVGKNNLQGFNKNDIQPSDLVLLYAAQKRAIYHLLPDFTTDSKEAARIIEELEEYYTQVQNIAVQMVFNFQKEIENQLKESEERFRLMVQSIEEYAIFRIDSKGYIESWNEGAEFIKGYKAEEIIGKHISVFHTPEDIEKGIPGYNLKIAAEKGRYETEGWRVRKDGTRFWANNTYTALFDNKNILTGFTKITHDITEKRKIEENRQYLVDILEATDDFVGFADAKERHIIYINIAGRKMIGLGPDDDVTKLKIDDVHPDWTNRLFRDKVIPIVLQEGIWKGECAFLSRERNEIPVSMVLLAHKDTSGKVIRFSTVSRDITERIKDEELEKLANAATKSFNSVVITSINGLIEWVNEGFTKLTGYGIEEVKNTHGEILRHGEETGISEDNRYYNEIITSKTPVSYESKNYSKNGKVYWTITTLTPVLDQNRQVSKIIAIDSDITQRKKMEEELRRINLIADESLERANKTLEDLIQTKMELEESMHVKDQFLANMSHEIRTPMNAILGFTQLLSKSNLTAEQKQYVDIITTSGSNLLVIVNDILDFSKLRSGKITFEKIEFSLTNTISVSIELLQPKAKEKKLKILTDINKNIPDYLIGDPTRLSQIVINLVGNAIKFSEQGEIEIKADKVREQESEIELMFSVSDKGIGIPKDKMKTIFEPFTQGSSETTRKYGGTGLGLAIVKQLVEHQGGTFSFTSKVNEGSVFCFTLPFIKGTGETINKKRTISEDVRKVIPSEGLNVLLVEDNELNAMLAEKILSDWKWKVEVADDGWKAIEAIKKQNFDIVLMDIQLPEMDGYETTRKIRMELPSPKRNIPIVAMTAHALSGEDEKCYQAGMDGYVSKPFTPDTLYKKILSAVQLNGQYANSNTIARDKVLKYSDLTYLAGLANGSKEFMAQMISLFIEETPGALQRMQAALERQNWKSLRAIAHKIKPSIMFMGLTEIQDDITLLEEYAARESNIDSIPATVDKITMACSQAITELKGELKKYLP